MLVPAMWESTQEGENMKIGIIGCGAIAREIISRRKDVVAVYDINRDKCADLGVAICNSLDELLENVDFVIEAASPKAVEDYALKIIRSGKDLLIMSVGGLVNRDFRERLFREVRERGVNLYIPSGAIGGLDIIRAARYGGISEVKITSIKNPKNLGVECDKRTLVFKGSAEEAIAKFPKSTNVTVLLLLATGINVDVEVYADPEVKENIHRIHLVGTFGIADIEIRNKPSERNPKTSYLAALSPVSILEFINSPVKIGV